MIYIHNNNGIMTMYRIKENSVIQNIRDLDGRVFKYTISKPIFEQLRKELDLWEIKI